MARQARRARRLIRVGTSDEFGWQQAVLAAIVVLAPAGFLWCASLAGGQVSPWLALLLPLAAALVVRADSVLTTGTWLVLGLLWLVQVPSPFTWWSVPAAGTALLAHVAGSLLAGAPPTTVWPAATVRRYRWRIGVVLAITVGVAVLAQVTLSLRTSGAAELSVVALLVVATWLWLGRRLDEESSDGSEAPDPSIAPAPSVRWDE
ncbi:hypothetical protein [Lapillicoccus sp.]|uniref:hypothetical protein n=1 Tax=Lapillicoccus sp. TaxID=1909287 RepID=UPI0025CEF95C|nr:hypothetical protein [Lapillicoccus sp.]